MNSNASTILLSRQDLIMQMMPIWLCFASLGIIWNPGLIINYISYDLQLSSIQTLCLRLPGLLSLLLLPFPCLMLIRRTGHKTAIMTSLFLWAIALLLPASDFYYDYPAMIVACSLMAMADTLMLTSLYLKIALLQSKESLPSVLSFIQSLVPLTAVTVPLIINGAFNVMIPTFGLGWRIIFLLFAILAMLAFSALGATPPSTSPYPASDLLKIAKTLLASGDIRKNMIAITCIAGINLISLQLISETISFFLFQAAGLLIGGLLLKTVPIMKMGRLGIAMELAGIILLWIEGTEFISHLSIIIIGFANASLFPLILSRAFISHPDKKYAVTALMMTALSGGIVLFITAIFTMMAFGQQAVYIILTATVLFMIYYFFYGLSKKAVI